MRRILFIVALMIAGIPTAHAGNPPNAAPEATLYKNPQCGCCESYADYLRVNGFDVTVKATNDLETINRDAGVPEKLEGCHAMFIDGYVIDGHVPVNVVRRLLSERPKIAGITLPGMPAGSPGMGGTKTEPFVVYALPKDGSEPTVFAKE
jgi:hypothetical protein